MYRQILYNYSQDGRNSQRGWTLFTPEYQLKLCSKWESVATNSTELARYRRIILFSGYQARCA